MHFLALVIFAANYEFSSLKAEETDSEAAIQVETVNLPPSMPPPSEAPPPPAQPAPPSVQAPPPPQPQVPDQLAQRPITPPSAAPTPMPTPTPTPQQTGASAAPTPSAAPQPSVSPTPVQTPTPEQVAAQREQIAKKMFIDTMREQGLDVPDDYQLPQGIKSFEELLIATSPEKQKELNDASSAYWQERFGSTPNNTRGSDQGLGPNTPPDPNAPTPDPNASYDPNAPRSGVRFGDLDRSLDRRLDGSRLNDVDLDPLRRPRLQNDLDTALDEEDPYRGVDELGRDLRNFDTGLGTPTPAPIVLPNYTKKSLGPIEYITFDYKGRKFSLQWPGSEEDNKRVSVKHYPGSNPSAIETFELRWLAEWQDNPEALVRTALEEYERLTR
ncbi:MAG: hypothetical protein ACO1RX_00935 [Candidatus Sericytochromatia bacterium]